MSLLHHGGRPARAHLSGVEVRGEIHEQVLLWRLRVPVNGALREVQCSMDHLGEEVFELRLVCEHRTLVNESFEDTSQLLRRAEELRSETRSKSRTS